MRLEIKLANPKLCNGCPYLNYANDVFCKMGYYTGSSGNGKYEDGVLVPDIIRSETCIINNDGNDGPIDPYAMRRAINDVEVGYATGGSPDVLIDNSKSWAVGAWKDLFCEIISGTGKDQTRKIKDNDKTHVFVNPDWDVKPDASSQYRIYVMGNNDDKLIKECLLKLLKYNRGEISYKIGKANILFPNSPEHLDWKIRSEKLLSEYESLIKKLELEK